MKLDAFSDTRRWRYALALVLGTAVAGMGYFASFGNLTKYAAEHAFPFPPGLPIGLDFGIPALLLLDSLRPSRFLRWSAWALTAFTVVANAAVTPGHNWVDRGLHAVMPAISIVFFHAARRKPPRDASAMDRIRWTRYLVSPVRTVRLRARMIAWEVTSYRDALALESAILYARAVLVAEYGKRSWSRTRKQVPVILRHELGTGQLPADLLYATDWRGPVRAWVRDTLDELDPERAARLAAAARSETVAGPVPTVVVQQSPWDRVWDRLDEVVSPSLTRDQAVQAYGLARGHFDQFRQHISGTRLSGLSGLGKPKALAVAQWLKTAYETGLDHQSDDRSPAADTTAPDGPAGTVPEPAGTASLNGGPTTPAGSPS